MGMAISIPADARSTIERAVANAESKTSAEIVPVIAGSSGRYDRPEDMAGLWLGGVAAILIWCLYPVGPGSDWGLSGPQLQAIAAAIVFLVGFFAGAIIAAKVGCLRYLFTPIQQMEDEVAARSRAVFFDSRVHHTAGATGLLIYISRYERMAAVLADREILEKLGQPSLDDLCKSLTNRLRSGSIADAMAATIEAAGDKLGAVLPRMDDDVNELADTLVLLED